MDFALTPEQMYMPPFEVGTRARSVREVLAAHRAVTGGRPKVGSARPYKFYGSDAAHLAAAGGDRPGQA